MVRYFPDFGTLSIDDAYQAELDCKLQDDDVNVLDSRGEYYFLLDRSGSMAGARIEKALEALKFFLKSLPPNSYFNIVSFGVRWGCGIGERSLSEFMMLTLLGSSFTSNSLLSMLI